MNCFTYIIFFFYLLFSFTYSLPNVREIFTSLHTNRTKLMPDYFEVSLESSLISQQIKRIPKSKISLGGTPELMLIFKKNDNFKLILKNVEPYYQNFFSLYESVVAQSGIFATVDRYNDYSKFIGNYRLYWLQSSQFKYSIKLIEKEALSGDYAIFSLDGDWFVVESTYYEENKKKAFCQYTYEYIREYKLPVNLKVTLFSDKKKQPQKLNIFFKNYSFKP